MDTNRVSKIACMRGDNVLLLFSTHLNKWHLPGGHIQVGESFEQGLVREVEEETGCKLQYYHRVRCVGSNIMLFIGKLKSGTIKLSKEHAKYAWVPINKATAYDVCKFTYRDLRYIQIILNAAKKSTKTEVDQNNIGA